MEVKMTGKPYRSKLLVHEDFIRKARSDGIAYRKIVSELYRIYGIRTGHNTVFSFVKTRSKKRKVITMCDDSHTGAVKQKQPVFKEFPKKSKSTNNNFDWGEKVFTYDRNKPIT
jgi:hypothetical protein